MVLPADVTVANLDAYFARVESAFNDITPGCEKRVQWDGNQGEVTDWALLYVHGFSATSEEVRPVPDNIAAALGANVVYTRLEGHGRDGAALGKATLNGWRADFDEALAAAKLVGRKILIMSTSTGGTLTAESAVDPKAMEDVVGLIFVAPNFAINNPGAFLLTLPGIRIWGPWVAGRHREFDVRNERHGRYWTTSYPTVSVVPVAEAVRDVRGLDFSTVKTPAFFFFSDKDEVVKPAATRKVIAAWGGPSQVINPTLGPQDDENHHVVTGDTLSPGQTEFTTQSILDWVKGLSWNKGSL